MEQQVGLTSDFFIPTIRICKNSSNTVFNICNIKNTRKICRRYKQTNTTTNNICNNINTIIINYKTTRLWYSNGVLYSTCNDVIYCRNRQKYIIGTILIATISIPLLYNFVLPDHAKKRIDIFLNPESDPRGSGYNIIQSKLAIGAGQLTGMGLLKGNQTQLGYLYPKQQTLFSL